MSIKVHALNDLVRCLPRIRQNEVASAELASARSLLQGDETTVDVAKKVEELQLARVEQQSLAEEANRQLVLMQTRYSFLESRVEELQAGVHVDKAKMDTMARGVRAQKK